jgi:hypothetical protein
MDQALGLEAYARTSVALEKMACLLAVWVPFPRVTRLLAERVEVEVSASSAWNWVQARGQQAMARLDEELKRLAAGEPPVAEALTAQTAALPLLRRYRSMGADGVSVPFRPTAGHPGGTVLWREVKVGVLARFCHRQRESGQAVCVLKQRRGVAVLGDIEALKPRLWLEGPEVSKGARASSRRHGWSG